MKYRFVKLKDIKLNLEYTWMLECDSFEILQSHNEKCMHIVIEKGLADLFNKEPHHLKTEWASGITQLQEITGDSLIKSAITLENNVIGGKIKAMFRFGSIYIRENGSYMVMHSDIEVMDVIERDELIYPQYTLKDIKITQWKGGTHFYAKVGNVEVSDENDNYKWNTYSEAKKHAENFVKNYIRN